MYSPTIHLREGDVLVKVVELDLEARNLDRVLLVLRERHFLWVGTQQAWGGAGRGGEGGWREASSGRGSADVRATQTGERSAAMVRVPGASGAGPPK